MTVFSTPLPVGCRLTSRYNPGRRILALFSPHRGTDWAGLYPGQKGVPVYAVADGTVVVASDAVGALPGHSGVVVAVDHGVLSDKNGSDRIRTNYGHLEFYAVDKGERVVAGQLLGYMGMTGRVTGIHLHFGVSQLNADGRTWTYFDPEPWLRSKGITVGVTPPRDLPAIEIVPAAVRKPSVLPQHSAKDETRQRRLAAMGLYLGRIDGRCGVAQIRATQAFQRAHGLRADGVWGNLTEQKYLANVALQKALNKMAGYDIRVDGYIGSGTKSRVHNVKERNAWRDKRGKITTTIDSLFLNRLRKVGAL